ncbi:MAG TPA: FAD-dependent oxidoreductase [Paracoccaceae bacterium]|nr:FAD-dependent oxidoreductase [Paracoccaceae bacterium]
MTAPATPFPRLFSPFRSGRLDLQSRLVMLPHGTAMVRDGIPTEGDIAYYVARAKGVGIVTIGGMVAMREAAFRARILAEGFNPEAVPAMRQRSEAVHALGARIVGQLSHLGRETTGLEPEFPPVGASALRSPRDPYPPHVLETPEIEAIIEGFAAAARNLQAADFDGVELHAAHGYLFAQFLSPAVNTRSDAWGGSPERRLRLLAEAVMRIRETCRPNFLIGVRLSADEEIADGLGVRDTVGIAQGLARLGAVDYLSITVGVRGTYVKDATAPIAPAARAAGIIRKESGLPIIVGQKIPTPELAEELLAEGVADMIGMARAFVADPRFAEKAAAGQGARIRPCVGLNQDCRMFSPHLHCAVNPETGREVQAPFDRLAPAVTPRRLAVIGGGPAGMEAARVAALRGHAVTLFEASDALGGQFLLAASLPHRSGLLRIIDHLVGELRHAGVTVKLGSRIDDLAELGDGFDAACIATGATFAPLSGWSGGLPALTWAEVLREGAPAPRGGGHAAFIDDGLGFWFSYGVTEMLVEAGWRVTLLTSSAVIGANLPHESVGPLLARLGAGGTRFRVLTGVEDSGPGWVQAVNLTSGEEERIECDLAVVQTGRLADPGPAAAPLGLTIRRVGDCVTPRRITHALFDGQKFARAL